MTVLLVGNPLSKDPPEDAKDQADQNLDWAMKCQLPDGSTCVESETEEDSEARYGDDVVGRAGSNDKSGYSLADSISLLYEGNKAGNNHSWGNTRQDKPQKETRNHWES